MKKAQKTFGENSKQGIKNVSPNYIIPASKILFSLSAKVGKKGKRDVLLFILSTRDITVNG